MGVVSESGLGLRSFIFLLQAFGSQGEFWIEWGPGAKGGGR